MKMFCQFCNFCKRDTAHRRRDSKQRLKAVVLPALLILVQGLFVSVGHARDDLKDLRPKSNSSHFFSPAAGGVSLQKATALVRKSTGGRVLSATTNHRSSGIEHRVRVLVDGERVITVTVDANGRIKGRR